MATLETKELASFMLDMQALAEIDDDTLGDMLKAEAEVVKKAQKAEADSMGVVDTGQTRDSIKIGKVKRTSKGISVYIKPDGYRTVGPNETRRSNTMVAFINEYGKHGQPARPFIRTANERAATSAVNAAAEIYDKYLGSHNL